MKFIGKKQRERSNQKTTHLFRIDKFCEIMMGEEARKKKDVKEMKSMATRAQIQWQAFVSHCQFRSKRQISKVRLQG